MKKVEWPQSVLDALTKYWLQADSTDRKAITQACHAIEKRLSNDPENEGESREAGRCITFELPLSVIFRVEADGRTVTVLKVLLMRRRSA